MWLVVIIMEYMVLDYEEFFKCFVIFNLEELFFCFFIMSKGMNINK